MIDTGPVSPRAPTKAVSAVRMSGMAASAAALVSTSTAIGIGPVAGVTRSTSRVTESSRITMSLAVTSVFGAPVARSTTETYATRSRACAPRLAVPASDIAVPTTMRKSDRWTIGRGNRTGAARLFGSV